MTIPFHREALQCRQREEVNRAAAASRAYSLVLPFLADIRTCRYAWTCNYTCQIAQVDPSFSIAFEDPVA